MLSIWGHLGIGSTHLKMDRFGLWKSTGSLHVLVMLVSVYRGRSPHILQKIFRPPLLCSAPQSSGAESMVRRTRLPPHQHKHSGEKEEKRKFCPYRKGIADRGGERFTLAHSVLSLSFAQGPTLLRRVPGFSDLPSRVLITGFPGPGFTNTAVFCQYLYAAP